MHTIRSKYECEIAASYLGLNDTSAYEYRTLNRPNGCIYASHGIPTKLLKWNTKEPKTKCGSKDGRFVYSCICAVTGKKMNRIYIIFRHPLKINICRWPIL